MKIILFFLILILITLKKNIYRKKIRIQHFELINTNTYLLEKENNKYIFNHTLHQIYLNINKICSKSINDSYFKKKMKNRITYIYLYYVNGIIMMFAIGFPYNNDQKFFLDLFCSNSNKKNHGKDFLKKVIQNLKKKKMKELNLRSANKKLITYYKKNIGFKRKISACNKNETTGNIYSKYFSNDDEGYWMSLCL